MSAAGPAVVIGAGNVGLGVMAEQLRAAGRPVVMVTRTQRDADRIVAGGVRVRRADGRTSPDVVLRGLGAVAVTDTSRVTRSLHEASVIVVAVGPGHAVEIAPLLADALMARRSPVNVMVCDNRRQAATDLRAMVAEHGDDRVLQHGYVGALVDRIVTRREQPDGSRVLLTETQGTVYVDAPSVRAPLEAVGQLRLVENFQAYVLRKLFVFSAGHAASAYLGGMRGHVRILEALQDGDVVAVARAAMREGQAGLSAFFGARFAGGAEAVDHSLRRYAAPHLDDTVERVGRDPMRKLRCGRSHLRRGPAGHGRRSADAGSRAGDGLCPAPGPARPEAAGSARPPRPGGGRRAQQWAPASTSLRGPGPGRGPDARHGLGAQLHPRPARREGRGPRAGVAEVRDGGCHR